ncbi:FtsH protease activity modulator HflK [Candidatus Vallotia lariciata]|uniref:FtsH protease activity modulator HflK n=1 Tax=Candidatus Vallotia laricis TaxID=2018052 RepID=UPI001D033317|nr:FtsH protease activity modulator HflK [Candidatus Vallotia lariciata]UDG83102.1 Modulator of FtsH protease HflK [Candidatus Vallotia lariciata]
MVKNKSIQSVWQRTNALLSITAPAWSSQGNSNVSLHPQNQGNTNKINQEGPPDLEELWRNFNHQIKRLFSQRDLRSKSERPDPPNSNSGYGGYLGLGIILSALIAIYIASGIYIVQEGQAGVVLQFGRYMYTTGSGIQWRLPYPFQSNESVNLSQVRSAEIGRDNMIRSTNLKDMSMLTQDENIIDVRFSVQYRVKDPAAFLFNNVNTEDAVTQAAETTVREIVGKNTMDYVLYEGREQVALELSQQIQQILDQYKTGISVSSVTMQNVQPPQQVQSAFDDAVKAGQDRERAKNEALAYANNVVPRAQGTAARIVADANGYLARVVAQAEGDAAHFNQVQAEYAKAPAVTSERMYLDTMQQIYTNVTKIMVDSEVSNNLLYLPLDKVMLSHSSYPQVGKNISENSLQNKVLADESLSDTQAAQDQPILNTPVNHNMPRSRDLFRNRDKGQ